MSLGPLMTDIAGVELESRDREVLRHPLVGGVILFSRNYHDIEQLKALTEELHSLRTPRLLIAVDHEGGRIQRFRQSFTELPPAAAYGALYDRDPAAALTCANQGGWLMASELRTVGVDFSFAPVLDVQNARSRIIDDRAFHRDPRCVARIAQAFIKGMHEAGMAAVGKHFPGHGSVVEDSHAELPVDKRSLYDLTNADLVPFRLVAKNIEGMMPAHVLFPEVDANPAGFSPIWIQEILRNEYGFQGIVFSDDLSMSGAAVVGGVEERTAAAIAAGCDVVLLCNDRARTEGLLTHFNYETEPLVQVRLMRMHGKGEQATFAELQKNAQWQTANVSLSRLARDPVLDLGDDRLV